MMSKSKKRRRNLPVASRPRKPRECGSCDACCVHYNIRNLPGYPGVKPVGEPCPHLLDQETNKCGLYSDPSRPKGCHVYKCLWLTDGNNKNRVLRAEDRPDISGIMMDVTNKAHPATKALKRPVVVARAVKENGFRSITGLAVIERILKLNHVVALYKGRSDYEFLAPTEKDKDIVTRLYSSLPTFKVL